MTVINIKTKQPTDDRPSLLTADQERVAAYLRDCAERVFTDCEKVRAVCGLDATLRMLGRVADEMRKQGRQS